jgi:hypothetical protein
MPVVIPNQPEGEKTPWPVERKISLVLEEWFDQRPVTELCGKAGISVECYCRWRQQFIDAARFGLTHPESMREAGDRAGLEERVRQLEAENAALRQRLRTLEDLCLAD